MLLASFGTPSPSAYVISDVIRAIATAVFERHAFLRASRIDDLKRSWEEAGDAVQDCVVFFSDCPHSEISQTMLRMRAPIVVTAVSTSEIVDYAIRYRGFGFVESARFATQVLCALDEVNGRPNVFHIMSEDASRPLVHIIGQLMAFYGLNCKLEQFEGILDQLGLTGPRSAETLLSYIDRSFVTPPLTNPSLDPAQSESLAVLAASYDEICKKKLLERASWPTTLFAHWDFPGTFLTGPMSLLGPARFILCGPYLHLTRGRWRMAVTFEVLQNPSGSRLGADVFSVSILSAVEFDLPAEGVFEFDIYFDVSDQLAPVELRLQLLTGAIEGFVILQHVELQRTEANLAKPSPSTSDHAVEHRVNYVS